MDKEIDRLIKVLSLAERETESFDIPENTWSSSSNDYALKLVGRVFTRKTVKFDFLANTLKKAINAGMGADLERIGDDRFLLSFNHKWDMQRTLETSPWNFENYPIILNKIGEDEDPLQVNLDWCDFFIHAHGLPLNRRTKEMAEFIGNKIGRFVGMEPRKSNKTRPDTLRFRAAINLTNPLPRFIKLRSPNRREMVISFTYERLSNFCFLCGVCDHIDRFCKLRYDSDFVEPESESGFPFGTWLRELPLAETRLIADFPAPRRKTPHPTSPAPLKEPLNSDPAPHYRVNPPGSVPKPTSIPQN